MRASGRRTVSPVRPGVVPACVYADVYVILTLTFPFPDVYISFKTVKEREREV